jgi:AcrR family transcriptional regulator
MTNVVRPWRGISAADRRAERRERLLAACLDVIGRDGVASTTVGAVCEQAGLTKRYFYESFSDRDAILAEVLDGLHTSLLGEIREALQTSGPDPLERARLTIRLLIAAMDDPRMARLYIEAPAHPVLQARRQEAYHVYAQLMTDDVLGIEHPDPGSRLAALVYVTGTTQAVMSWLEGAVALTREELVEELAHLGARGRPTEE